MDKNVKQEAFAYLNKEKKQYFKKYFENKDLSIGLKNALKTIFLKFTHVNSLFYFLYYSLTKLIDNKAMYFSLSKENRNLLKSSHKSLVKINMHSDAIYDEILSIINKW